MARHGNVANNRYHERYNCKSRDARITANKGDIAAIYHADQQAQSMVAAIQTAIATAILLIETNQGDFVALKGDLQDFETRLTNAENDLASEQNRVTQACNAGYAIRYIYETGLVYCEKVQVTVSFNVY